MSALFMFYSWSCHHTPYRLVHYSRTERPHIEKPKQQLVLVERVKMPYYQGNNCQHGDQRHPNFAYNNDRRRYHDNSHDQQPFSYNSQDDNAPRHQEDDSYDDTYCDGQQYFAAYNNHHPHARHQQRYSTIGDSNDSSQGQSHIRSPEQQLSRDSNDGNPPGDSLPPTASTPSPKSPKPKTDRCPNWTAIMDSHPEGMAHLEDSHITRGGQNKYVKAGALDKWDDTRPDDLVRKDGEIYGYDQEYRDRYEYGYNKGDAGEGKSVEQQFRDHLAVDTSKWTIHEKIRHVADGRVLVARMQRGEKRGGGGGLGCVICWCGTELEDF
ncbi:hypothetical protein BJ875DRAFT_436242 [Amylocarpus encephaloides]|uniref:Uncharacterized protein n=1 Tax=Amylocarpus encephaloides TaxID=45428 RepID=A0A9P8CAB4_9HELO|nr:hypothetical protein BJ875DRAFT_436242 [Amylocarpus encephaloides]